MTILDSIPEKMSEKFPAGFVEGSSKFVVAYAIHKLFAPVRISMTLGFAPFIVKILRNRKILK